MIYRTADGDVIVNGSATSATNDANGNNIATTYLPKSLSGVTGNFDSPSQSIIQLLSTGSSGTDPSGAISGNQWLLLTDILSNENWCGQLAIGFNGLAWRGKAGTTTWDNWKRIPLGDGTGASGNWSINAATATKATKIVDAGNSSRTITIRYGGNDASPTDYLPMHENNSGNLVPVSVDDFRHKSMNIITIVKYINTKQGQAGEPNSDASISISDIGNSTSKKISINFSGDLPNGKKIVGVSSIRSSDSYMIPYITEDGVLNTFVSRVYDNKIEIINKSSYWKCDLYITLILANAT